MPTDLYELDNYEWDVLPDSASCVSYLEAEDESLKTVETVIPAKSDKYYDLAYDIESSTSEEHDRILNPILAEELQVLANAARHLAVAECSAYTFDCDREVVRALAADATYTADSEYDHFLLLDILTEDENKLRLVNATAGSVEEADPNVPIRNFVSLGQTPPPVALLRTQKQQMRRGLAIREGNNFKGQYAHKTSLARVSIAKEGSLNKLARYYMQGGHQAKAQGQVLEALANLYDIMLSRPNHELILRLGGYSPVVGHLIYATLMHNPNTLLNWAGRQYAQTYAFKCFNTTKQIRKRTRVKRGLQCVHVPQAARQSQSLRMLHFFTEDQKYHKVEERMFSAMLDMIFKYKKGVLYGFKLKAYRSAFQRARQRQV